MTNISPLEKEPAFLKIFIFLFSVTLSRGVKGVTWRKKGLGEDEKVLLLLLGSVPKGRMRGPPLTLGSFPQGEGSNATTHDFSRGEIGETTNRGCHY